MIGTSTFDATSGSSTMTIDDSQAFGAIFANYQEGDFVFTVTVTDARGNSSTASGGFYHGSCIT